MDKNKKVSNKKLTNLIHSLQDNINLIYKNTYISQPTNSKDLESIKNRLDKSLDDIGSNNQDIIGTSNISKMYSRIDSKHQSEINGVVNNIEDIFNNKSYTDTLLLNFAENKYLKEYDDDIDILCKYMPKLKDALNVKKDGVLSADNFSKDFLNVVNESNVNNTITFQQRIQEIKRVHNLNAFCEECYDAAATYGERFIYIVPYNKAFNKLLKDKACNINSATHLESVLESVKQDSKEIITENFSFDNTTGEYKNNNILKEDMNIKVELNLTGVLESTIKERVDMQILREKTTKFEKTVSNDLEFEKPANDGFIDTGKMKKDDIKIDIPGCIVKSLKRENVKPYYMDNMCLGYYHLECEYEDIFTKGNNITSMGAPVTHSEKMRKEFKEKNETMLRHLSSRICKFIDSNFVKSNQDLKKEIYMMLKYNQISNNTLTGIKITFLPVDDVIHMKFKTDPITHRGISDLDDALIPAKLYVALYTTNTLGIITRGFDKRVYYVKNSVDSNISKTLLNTLNQIKKSNFGSREITNMKNMLNITGKYNDLLIPLNSSGDSPIQFELMQGQDINPQTELLETLEEMAISSVQVPYEYVQSTKMVDFATRLTMSNGKFLRTTFKRQSQAEIFFSLIVSKIYNYEYGENDNLSVMLPPPSFLNISNANQIMQNVNEYITQIVEMEMSSDEDEELRMMYTKKLKYHYLAGYLDLDAIVKFKDQATLEYKQTKKSEE